MTVLTPRLRDAARRIAEEDRLELVRIACQDDPKALINEIRFFDPTSELWVEFKMYPPEGWEAPIVPQPNGEFKFVTTGAKDWLWQSLIIDWWHDPEKNKYLILKARQLGITLLACSYALWQLLYRPGSFSVAYSYTEDEARKLVEATWMMFESLPPLLKEHVQVIQPTRSMLPAEWIRIRHDNGLVSSFQALPATKKHGHGTRVSFAIMDEVARQDYAREIYTAINPAVSRGGKLAMISTANGVSNPETNEGNFFHVLYATKEELGLEFLFLPWNMEPTRDQEWYQREALALPDVERKQQYPLTEADAFTLSGEIYFDREALEFYGAEVNGAARPEVRVGQFVVKGRRRAEFMTLRDGVIEIYEAPRTDGHYAIGVDTSTGRGSDYTSADVVDLSSGAIVAHLHAKMEAPRAAVQLHYLGKWYNTAKIAVERQGGYGEALIFALRDGNQNLPVYPNQYEDKRLLHRARKSTDLYGIPMGSERRHGLLENLRGYLRQRLFPWLPGGHVDELGTFVYTDTKPSPRAQDGCNDDRVISLAIACEMYRQYGERPDKVRRRKPQKYVPPPTRQL